MDIPPLESGNQENKSSLAARFAAAIVERRLEVPALFFLELHRPFGTMLHTSALFAEPFLKAFVKAERLSELREFLEDRENIEKLIAEIEEAKKRARDARRLRARPAA